LNFDIFGHYLTINVFNQKRNQIPVIKLNAEVINIVKKNLLRIALFSATVPTVNVHASRTNVKHSNVETIYIVLKITVNIIKKFTISEVFFKN
jgi:hypothetical protein